MSETKSRKKSHIGLIIFIVLFLMITAGMIFFVFGLGPVSDKSSVVAVEIPEGTGAMQIVELLDENKLIKNKFCSKLYCKLNPLDSLQANTYLFNKNMSFIEMINIVNTGDTKYIPKKRMTIIEGSTIPDAAAEVAKQTGKSTAEVIAIWNDREYLKELIDKYWFLSDAILKDGIKYPLEGYLYPDTYFVAKSNNTVESLTENLLDMTATKLNGIKDGIKGMNMSIHEFLSFASVVEGETQNEAEAPKVAGVFLNRLKVDMPLQSDITVLYAIGGKKHIDVTTAETHYDSPYNTYANRGLPIGPICAVSEITMNACINYEKSDYFYFFAKKDGSIVYAKTLAEHEKNLKKYKWY